MEEIPLLQELAVLSLAAVVVSLIVAKLRLPAVTGLLLSGALIGPRALGFVTNQHDIEVFAEVGVVLLLFTIGLELSLSGLKHILRRVALGGFIQVGVTTGIVYAIARALGQGSNASLFFGFVVALSSTAIVLRGLTERRELDAPHGKFIVGTLIFQDLCVVPMVLIVPLLGSDESAGAGTALAWALAKAILVVIGVIAVSRIVVPYVFRWVASSRSREVFLLAVVALCVGTAYLTSLAGLSLALGAFLGGLVVSDTEFKHRALGDMLPLRDIFVSIFFVSLGMFFDPHVLIDRPVEVGILLIGFIIGKGIVATLAALLMRFPARAAWLAGVGLAQFGEFGFVLVKLGTGAAVVDPSLVAPLLNAGIISMFLTPLMLQQAPHITAGERLLAPLARLLRARGIDEADEQQEIHRDHVVIIGYGVAGQLVARSMRRANQEHIVLELNSENVRTGQEDGAPVFYADATSEEALHHAHVGEARAVVVVINEHAAMMRIVGAVRRLSPTVPVILRTHYLDQLVSLRQSGADMVIADEVEGGVEVVHRLLDLIGTDEDLIEIEMQATRDAARELKRY